MGEEIQPELLSKSAIAFEVWKASLINIIKAKHSITNHIGTEPAFDEKVKPYYDQGLMPDVCFKELFNK